MNFAVLPGLVLFLKELWFGNKFNFFGVAFTISFILSTEAIVTTEDGRVDLGRVVVDCVVVECDRAFFALLSPLNPSILAM